MANFQPHPSAEVRVGCANETGNGERIWQGDQFSQYTATSHPTIGQYCQENFRQTDMTADFLMSHVVGSVRECESRSSSPGELILCDPAPEASSSDSEDYDTGSTTVVDTSLEASALEPDRHYHRNEVVVDPKSAALFDPNSEELDQCNPLVIQPCTPQSSSQGQWSRPGSANPGSRPSSAEPEVSSPVSFPSAVEVLRQGQSVLPQQQPLRPVIVGPKSWSSDDEDDPDETVGDESRDADTAVQEMLSAPTTASYTTNAGSVMSLPPSGQGCIITQKSLSQEQQDPCDALFGGTPNVTLSESLQLLDQHINKLSQQLAEHSVKLSHATDPQVQFLMTQQQKHLLEAQRLLLHNRQLMLEQMSGDGVQTGIFPQDQTSLYPQEQETFQSEPSNLQSSAYPSLLQQLSAPPLSHFLPAQGDDCLQSYESSQDALPQTSGVEAVVKRSDSPAVLNNTLGVIEFLSDVKREVITPPIQGQCSRGPSPVQDAASVGAFGDASSTSSQSDARNMSCLRGILSRPPIALPLDGVTSSSRPVQAVAPFIQRPVKSQHKTPLSRAQAESGLPSSEEHGETMTKISVSQPAVLDMLINGTPREMGVAVAQLVPPPWEGEQQPCAQPEPAGALPDSAEVTKGDYAVRYATSAVKRRRRRPLGETKKPYFRTCAQCEQVFTKPDDFKDHQNMVHAAEFKVCCVCQRFWSVSSVVQI